MEFSPQWKALLGVRWERYETEARATSRCRPPPSPPVRSPRTDNMCERARGPHLAADRSGSRTTSPGATRTTRRASSASTAAPARRNLNADQRGARARRRPQNYELGAQWDIGSVQLRTAVFRNEKTNARMVDETGTTVLAGKRRVDGIEFEALRTRSRRTGRSTAASRSWTARSSRRAGQRPGQDAARRARDRRQRLDRLQARRRLGDRRRRARPEGHLAHRHEPAGLADPRLRAARRDGRVRAAEVGGARQRLQPDRQDLLTSAATTTARAA